MNDCVTNNASLFSRQAVELNINKVFSETAISGNDYLKNLIHLPFFLQNSALRKVNLAQKVAANRERYVRRLLEHQRAEIVYFSPVY